jgi:hypothetical protein
MTSLVALADAAALFETPPDAPRKAEPKAVDRNRKRRLANGRKRGMVAPIIVRNVDGEQVVDGATYPAHLRRYFGVTTKGGTMRARPHRNPQGVKGGQRGNGALHDGKVHGLTPTGKV